MTDFAAAPPLRRLRPDKWAFFIALLIGVGIIIGFERASREKMEAVVACVGLLLLYAFGVTKVPALKLRYDQAADNCYYLGLLFTLTSLGVALFSFASLDGASEAILRNFGVAIFTTIAGLGLRVLISQFREDPEDLEHESREALAETVRRLRGELDQSVAELQRFTDGVRQALQETTEAARSSTTDTLAEAIRRFEGALTETTRSFTENSASFNKRATAINGSLEKVSGALESFTDRIGSVRADPLLVQEGLRPAFDAAGAAVADFAGTLDGRRQSLDEALARLSGLADVLGRLDQSSDDLAAASSRLQSSAAALESGSGHLEDLRRAAAAASEASADLARNLEGAISRTGAVAEESIRRIEASASSVATTSSEGLTAVTEAAHRTAETLRRLDADFEGSGETVQRVRRELTELAAWIIARLERA